MNRRRFWWLFGLIMLVAVVIRFYKLGSVPIGLYWDEAAMLVDAKSVSTTGKDMHRNSWFQAIYPSYGDYKLPVYIWLASASVKLIGVSDYALRLPSALAGVWTVIVAGLIAKELARLSIKTTKFANLAQLWVMVVMAVSPWSVLFSRTGFESHVAQSLSATSIWLLLVSRNKPWLFLLVPIFGSLATYTYFAVRFVWPFAFIVVSVLAFNEKFEIKKLLTSAARIALGLGLYALLFVPMMNSPHYQASNQFRLGASSILNSYDYPVQSNIYRELAGNISIDRLLFHRHTLLLREFVKNVGNHMSPNYIFVSGDVNLRHGTSVHGLFLLVFLPFLFLGLVSLYKTNWRALVILVVWWLAALIPPSVPVATPHSLRSLGALVPIAILIGAGVTFVWPKLRRWTQLAGIGVIIFCAIEFSYYYFTQYIYESGVYWQGGYKDVALKILELRKEKNIPQVYVHPFDERFYLWLMAYGPYQGTDFQSWQTIHYMVEQIDEIHMPHGWREFSLGSETVLVVTKDNPRLEIPQDWIQETIEIRPDYIPDTFQFMILKKD